MSVLFSQANAVISFHCSIVIVAKLNKKSDNFNSEFSYNYDIATYSLKVGV